MGVVTDDQLNLDSSKMPAPLWQNVSLTIGQRAHTQEWKKPVQY
jgi:hypothetical protein